MSNDAFHEWVTENILIYYPNTSKEDGRRMIAKVNSGTGRNHIEGLASIMLNSKHIFGGTPNRTESNQKIDQLFSVFKKGLYNNRDRLFEVLVSIYGPKARLIVNDMEHIIFGGRREFPENDLGITHNDLNNAKDTIFKEHILDSCKKVGYYPAT